MAGNYQTIVTVSQLGRYVKALLEEQKPLADIMVKGELSNVSYRSSSGHLYFSLRDGDSVIRCVMFSRYATTLTQLPQDGVLAIVRGSVSFYERDGSVELMAYDLQQLSGAGKVQKDLDSLKKCCWKKVFLPNHTNGHYRQTHMLWRLLRLRMAPHCMTLLKPLQSAIHWCIW